MKELQDCLIGLWFHSHEEDNEQEMVYRPGGFSFPPSRGRIGFEFRAGGEVIYHGIASADGPEQVAGRWTIEDSKWIRIEADSVRIQPVLLEVLTCAEDKFTSRRPMPG